MDPWPGHRSSEPGRTALGDPSGRARVRTPIRGLFVRDQNDLGRVLVTGATGFLGYEVASALVRRGLHPRLMVRRPERGRLLTPLGAEVVHANLLTPESLARAVEEVDTVIHLAARATFERYERIRPTIVDGSSALMRAGHAAGVKRFVFASSLLVYGGQPDPIDASTPTSPQIGYGRAKVEAEDALRREAGDEVALSILRLPHVYGARSFLFDQLKAGWLPFPGDGTNVYSHLHVRDAAEMLIEVAQRGWTGTSPIADDAPTSWNAFFEVLSMHYPKMRLLRIPSALAIAGARALELAMAWRDRPTLHTADTVRGWLLDLNVAPGLVRGDLGLSLRHPSIDSGIPASLDSAVSYRWLHPTIDRAAG